MCHFNTEMQQGIIEFARDEQLNLCKNEQLALKEGTNGRGGIRGTFMDYIA